MNVNASMLIEMNILNTNTTKTQPQNRNDYRPMSLFLINHRLNKNKLSKAIYKSNELRQSWTIKCECLELYHARDSKFKIIFFKNSDLEQFSNMQYFLKH